MKSNSVMFKKLYFTVISVVVIFAICACTKAEDLNADDIFIIDDGVLQFETDDLNYRNVICAKTVSLIDSTAEATKTEKINGIEYKMEYCETLLLPVTDKKVHEYLVCGTEDHFIYFNPDGSLDALLFDFAKIDISPTASATDINPIIIDKLKGIIDLTEYEYVDIPEDNKKTKEKFGIYDFLYYNMNSGYMTDYVKVSVSDDGDVFGFSINNIGTDIPNLMIDKNLEDRFLSEKLKSIYDTSNKTYKSYDTVFNPIVVFYNGELCTEHFVSANYVDNKTGQEISDYIIRLLIPVRLVTDANK